MVFGGLQKQSLIDFPGKLSCVLFTSGCNFDCPYCHNPELAKGHVEHPLVLNENNVYDFLAVRKGFLDGVVISGGEPTLQHGLAALCNRIKNMDYPVKLDTNGSRPGTLKHLIHEGLVDYIAMDIKTDPFDYTHFITSSCDPQNICDSIELIMDSGVPYEFRTTCIKPFVDADIIEQISQLIEGAELYALQQFKNERVLSPEFFEKQNDQYSRDQLEGFQSIAAKWVKSCIVR